MAWLLCFFYDMGKGWSPFGLASLVRQYLFKD
jgi:hypothetical protein